MGLLAYPFKFIKNPTLRNYSKAVFGIVMCCVIDIAADKSTFTNSRFIAALIFGYVCQRIWGSSECPNDHLYNFFFLIQPFLFGCIGAQLVFTKIVKSYVGKAIGIILLGVSVRAGVAYIVSSTNRYTVKERLFFSICWVPKATVQATVSGLFLAEALKIKNAEYITYGENIQTIAIIAILVCAPLGSILVSTFGDVLLERPFHSLIAPAQTEEDKKKQE